ncbi:hypothetical protein MNBD_PLANCTO02-1001 [hydrothermal vent metagenome]|uniref:FHA domain-containing protein n=1 Tax=hydrothermal vent metagenome TaxID=652676 RepID=A0A3B1E2B2_9ZZZZ
MPELIIRSGKLSGRKLVLPEEEIVIGRDDDCKIRLTSADVSRRHCRILPTAKGMIVRDLKSRNGTFINEEPVIEAMLLKAGDKLRIGPMVFEVPPVEEVSPPPVAPSSEKKPPAATRSRKKKKHIALPLREKLGTNHSTDEDIVSWLSAGDEDEEVSTGDTTIIPRSSSLLEDKKSDDRTEEKQSQAKSTKQPAPKSSAPSDFESLAKEAAEIIRKHWESVQSN